MKVKTFQVALIFSACTLAALSAPSYAQSASSDARARAAANSRTVMPVIIPAGTPIAVALDNDLSSESAKQGDRVTFHVVSDYSEFGHVLITAGTTVRGSITKVDKRSHGGDPGNVTVSVTALRAVDGTRIPLRGTKAATGKNRQAQASLLGIVTLGIGATKKGLAASMPAGTQLTVFTNVTKTIVVPR
jgi:hypothetical protein